MIVGVLVLAVVVVAVAVAVTRRQLPLPDLARIRAQLNPNYRRMSNTDMVSAPLLLQSK